MVAAFVWAATFLVFVSVAQGQPAKADGELDGGSQAPYAAGELIVTFRDDIASNAAGGVIASAGAEVEKELPDLGALVISIPEVKNERAREVREGDLERIKTALERSPIVAAVDYNYVRDVNWVPNDPRLGAQWGLGRVGARKAWDTTRGGWVRIAVVDGGAAGHPDLRSKIVAQRDFYNNDGVAEDQTDGHGTHVAGIAAAATNNGIGISGGCPYCGLLIAKAVGPRGGYDSDISDAIVWSVRNGAKVINMSIGGPGSSTVLENAVNYAVNRGVVVVAAAGNSNSRTPEYPAAYPRVIAVAATDRYDKRAPWSNWGPWIDVSAPGVGVLSTVPGGYRYYSGTSMAAPHVSALAGLMANQGLSASEIRSRIYTTSTDLGPTKGYDWYYGHGRINMAWAVQQ